MRRNKILSRRQIYVLSLAVWISSGTKQAFGASDTEYGMQGTNGMAGTSSANPTAGTPGGAASASAISGDTDNLAFGYAQTNGTNSVTGGYGGTAFAGSTQTGGAGGNGGSGTAVAVGTLTLSAAVSATGVAYGGTGGMGGPGGNGSPGGNGGSGGAGGDALVTAIASNNSTCAVTISATATGGGGGNGGANGLANHGSGGLGGNGGTASLVTLIGVSIGGGDISISSIPNRYGYNIGGIGGAGQFQSTGGTGGLFSIGTVTGAATSSGGVTITLSASGGQGGPNQVAGNAGVGGSISVSTISGSSSSGDVNIDAYSMTGGTGGKAYVGGFSAGNGGSISLGSGAGTTITGTSITGNVYVTASFTGGTGGQGEFGANGGNGGSVTLVNVVGGSTDGTMNLSQTAIGGDGGVTDTGTAGAGGNALSSLWFTQTASGVVIETATAFGGLGGAEGTASVNGGNGGSAFASASAQGPSFLNVYATANQIGGNGGEGGSGSGAGNYGGAGGAATLGSSIVNLTTFGTITLGFIAMGGKGGDGTNDASGGIGGNVSMGTISGSSSYGGSVSLNVIATGGAGGNCSDNGNGGAGGNASLWDPITGFTAGSIALFQSATGGSGGYGGSSGLGGVGGNAISSLTFTQTGLGNVAGTVQAVAGNGGAGVAPIYGTGAPGGNSTAFLSLTAIGTVSGFAWANSNGSPYADSNSGGIADIGTGGSGGGAFATAIGTSTSTLTNSSGVNVSAIAFGQQGGDATSVFGTGGAGGAATAVAFGTNSGPDVVLVMAESTGGYGGRAFGNGYSGGVGGGATLTAFGSSADGGTVSVTGAAIGGDGGTPARNNLLYTPPYGGNEMGGMGANVILINAVSAATSGSLALTQTAIGGNGGGLAVNSEPSPPVIGGAGGYAISSLTFVQSQARSGIQSNLACNVTATGGYGQYIGDGDDLNDEDTSGGGAGGGATAYANISRSVAATSSSIDCVNATAIGGDGGGVDDIWTFSGNNPAGGWAPGGSATATAIGSNTGPDSLYVTATAIGGNPGGGYALLGPPIGTGGSAWANAAGTSTSGPVQVNATANAGSGLIDGVAYSLATGTSQTGGTVFAISTASSSDPYTIGQNVENNVFTIAFVPMFSAIQVTATAPVLNTTSGTLGTRTATSESRAMIGNTLGTLPLVTAGFRQAAAYGVGQPVASDFSGTTAWNTLQNAFSNTAAVQGLAILGVGYPNGVSAGTRTFQSSVAFTLNTDITSATIDLNDYSVVGSLLNSRDLIAGFLGVSGDTTVPSGDSVIFAVAANNSPPISQTFTNGSTGTASLTSYFGSSHTLDLGQESGAPDVLSNYTVQFSLTLQGSNVNQMYGVELAFGAPAIQSNWTGSSGLWNSTSHWVNSYTGSNSAYVIPQFAVDTAVFASNTYGGTVSLDNTHAVGALIFATSNSYTLTQANVQGTLVLDNGGVNATAMVSDTLGSHQIAVPVILNSNVNVAVSSGNTLTFSNMIAGQGNLNFYTPGTAGGKVVFSGTNCYLGMTTVGTAMTLTLQSPNALEADVQSNLYVPGEANIKGTLDLDGNYTSLQWLIGSGTVENTATGSTVSLTLGIDAVNDNTFSGTIMKAQGDIALVVGGTISNYEVNSPSGTSSEIILTGTNTYSGGTTIDGGTLSIPFDAAVGTGPVMFAGGVLQFDNYSSNLSFYESTNTILGAIGSSTLSGVVSNSNSATSSLTYVGPGTLTLMNTNTYTGNTIISAGSLVLGVHGALPRDTTLTVGNGVNTATLQLAPNVGASTLSSLTINAGSSVDIANGALTINFASPTNDPVSTIAEYLLTGYETGSWVGTSTTSGAIISSTAATGSAGEVLSVGYNDGNTDNGAAGANQIVIRYTLGGDANLDGQVNSADLLAVVQNFNKSGTDWAHGNFTYITSGVSTTSADLLLVIQNFNKTLTPAGTYDAIMRNSSSVASSLTKQQVGQLQAAARTAATHNNPAPIAPLSRQTMPANSGFQVNVANPVNANGYSTYVVSALNDGGGTGTSLVMSDLTVTTPGTGTAGAMRVDTADDIDGDGKKDANVVGAPDQTFGQPTPSFGSTLGTFIGLPFSPGGTTVGGSFPLLVSPADYETTLGTLSSAYSHLHSLQVISIGDVEDDTTAAPFANIVVPTGTEFDLSGYLGGDMGSEQWINITNQSFVGSSALIALGGEGLSGISAPEVTLPEPASLGVLAILGSGLLLRRRRRNAVPHRQPVFPLRFA